MSFIEQNFIGEAVRLDSIDISATAFTINCGEDHLHAVMEVETRGGGFDTHKRIKMLFEPHVFYRELTGEQRQRAVSMGLAYERWGQERYPSDSYPRLKQALEINAEAALRSCSWGLGQIMGFNHLLAGYSSVYSMIESFLNDEAVHLAAMVQFIISSGLDDELRREDWRGFARGYNGAGYAKHGYHTKLKRAFDKWQRIDDTEFTDAELFSASREFQIDRILPDPNPPMTPVLSTRGMVLRRGMTGPDVENLQGILKNLGFQVGHVDGNFGRLTDAAVVAFQREHGLEADGYVGELTWAALNEAKPRPAREVSEAVLAERGDNLIVSTKKADRAMTSVDALLGATFTSGGAAEIAKGVQQAEGALEIAQRILVEYWPILIVGLLLFVAVRYGKRVTKGWRTERVQEAQSYAYIG